MKTLLPLISLASVLTVSCGAQKNASESSAARPNTASLPDVDSAFDARIAAAIKAVNANKESQVYSAKGFDKDLFLKAMADYMECKGISRSMKLLKTRWDIVRIVDHGTHSAMMLNYGFVLDDGSAEMQPDVWETLAIQNDPSEGAVDEKCESVQRQTKGAYTTPRFMLFSEAFKSPKVLRAGFENQPAADRPGLFYAEVTDTKSVEHILRSVYTGSPFSRLSVDLAKKPNGKLSWDPTPGRTWSVLNPTYDLDRGAISIEIGDGFADLLDRDYAGAAKGANYKLFPWSAGSVRQILINGELVEVLSPELAKQRVPGADKPAEEGGDVGTGPVDGGFGTNPVGGGFGIGT